MVKTSTPLTSLVGPRYGLCDQFSFFLHRTRCRITPPGRKTFFNDDVLRNCFIAPRDGSVCPVLLGQFYGDAFRAIGLRDAASIHIALAVDGHYLLPGQSSIPFTFHPLLEPAGMLGNIKHSSGPQSSQMHRLRPLLRRIASSLKGVVPLYVMHRRSVCPSRQTRQLMYIKPH